jgi:hypothetical protein
LNVGSCQETPLCRTHIWRHWDPHFTPSIVPVGEQPTTCPAQKAFLRHLFLFLTRDARAMALRNPRFYQAASIHHTSIFYCVFARNRTFAFHPGPRKQAFVVFRGLCLLLSINVLACSKTYLPKHDEISKTCTEADSKRDTATFLQRQQILLFITMSMRPVQLNFRLLPA